MQWVNAFFNSSLWLIPELVISLSFADSIFAI